MRRRVHTEWCPTLPACDNYSRHKTTRRQNALHRLSLTPMERSDAAAPAAKNASTPTAATFSHVPTHPPPLRPFLHDDSATGRFLIIVLWTTHHTLFTSNFLPLRLLAFVPLALSLSGVSCSLLWCNPAQSLRSASLYGAQQNRY